MSGMVERVKVSIAASYQIKVVELIGGRRKQHVVEARHLAIYIASLVTTLSTPALGRLFGGRDHTTIMHAIGRMEKKANEDPAFSQIVSEYVTAFQSPEAVPIAPDIDEVIDAVSRHLAPMIAKTIEKTFLEREAQTKIEFIRDPALIAVDGLLTKAVADVIACRGAASAAQFTVEERPSQRRVDEALVKLEEVYRKFKTQHRQTQHEHTNRLNIERRGKIA